MSDIISTWKYALIKVDEEDGEDICEVVELYLPRPAKSNDYAFARAVFNSCASLENALKDIKNDGINTYFWENGKFTYSFEDQFWNWESNHIESHDVVRSYSSRIYR
jgi:hypothetical protein